MKKIIIMVAATVIVIATGATVHAANSTFNDVLVQTNVLAKCYFNTASATLTIADIDPSSGSAATNFVSLNYACTTHATAPYFTQDAGTSSCAGATAGALGGDLYLKNGATCMKYKLSAPALTATGFSSFNSADVTATIAVSDFQDKPAGAYNDTVKLTVNY
jgi:hypothetical protein